MEEEKFDREERYINQEGILSTTELEEEPMSQTWKEIACEDTDRFTLAQQIWAQATDILKMLENQVKSNQKRHMEMEKISSRYERLRLDVSEKYKSSLSTRATVIWAS